jgi:branched-chain amino acid transport system ATP-binding protein
MKMLRVENLTKYFGEVHAVDHVNLEIKPNINISIIGPNGAGKTTLINLIAGYLTPDSGEIYFKGMRITGLPVHERVKMGVAKSFQIMSLFPNLKTFESVQIAVAARLGKTMNIFKHRDSFHEVNEEVINILEMFGHLDKKDLPVKSLSHGDQRLLEVAMSVATKPQIVFLDEPTSGTNIAERQRIINYVRKVAEEAHTTIVLIEHDMDVVFDISERIIVLHNGKIIADGDPSEVKSDKVVKEIYLGEEVK